VIAYSEVTFSPDAVFLAVPDTQIAPVGERLSELLSRDVPVFHTSGATPADRIPDYFLHRGVLWPIRSLRKGEPVTDWRDLPLVTYGLSPVAKSYLAELAHRLSDTVAYLDDTQRAQLHLAAVFSNNFVTALYEVSYRLCADYDIPFELLLPIIRKTAEAQDGHSPALRQTGAAMRGDHTTMERHLSLLDNETYRQLYRDLSGLIFQYRLPEYHAYLRRNPDDDLQDEGVA
jgi:hypothetical protein